MFTGLVETVGRVSAREKVDGGMRVRIAAPAILDGVRLGDSIAVDGACLTVVAFDEETFTVDAVAETLRRTVIGDRDVGAQVNLERSMRLGDRLGGHLVQGHIDGVGSVRDVMPDGAGVRLTIDVPPQLGRYVVEKGSITVDGVSLTVAATSTGSVEIALIPHTLAETTLGSAASGRRVNLEVDLVAKYVEALSAPYRPSEGNR